MTFEDAVLFVMKYEVGPHFTLDQETKLGMCTTKEQKRKVGYVNDPADAGGETKFGIAANANIGVDIRLLDWVDAKDIYKRKYWDAVKADKLQPKTAIVVFDCAVNHGVSQASKFLQRAVNVPDDGIIGERTIEAARINPDGLVADNIIQQRREFFHALVHRKPLQGRFLNGWLARCADLENFVNGAI